MAHRRVSCGFKKKPHRGFTVLNPKYTSSTLSSAAKLIYPIVYLTSSFGDFIGISKNKAKREPSILPYALSIFPLHFYFFSLFPDGTTMPLITQAKNLDVILDYSFFHIPCAGYQ